MVHVPTHCMLNMSVFLFLASRTLVGLRTLLTRLAVEPHWFGFVRVPLPTDSQSDVLSPSLSALFRPADHDAGEGGPEVAAEVLFPPGMFPAHSLGPRLPSPVQFPHFDS